MDRAWTMEPSLACHISNPTHPRRRQDASKRPAAFMLRASRSAHAARRSQWRPAGRAGVGGGGGLTKRTSPAVGDEYEAAL